jgi:hypothetical protein
MPAAARFLAFGAGALGAVALGAIALRAVLQGANEAPAQEPEPLAQPAEQGQAPAGIPVEAAEVPEPDPIEELVEESPAQEQPQAEEPASEQAPVEAPADQGRREYNGRHARHVKEPCTLPQCNHKH